MEGLVPGVAAPGKREVTGLVSAEQGLSAEKALFREAAVGHGSLAEGRSCHRRGQAEVEGFLERARCLEGGVSIAVVGGPR
jgi:hypothetical protein